MSIAPGVTKLGGRALGGCTSLREVSVPEGVTAVADRAFMGDASLETMRLPQSLQKIGALAMARCSNLERLVLPGRNVSVGAAAFDGCSKLADSSGFIILDGVCLGMAGDEPDVRVPEGVEAIAPGRVRRQARRGVHYRAGEREQHWGGCVCAVRGSQRDKIRITRHISGP